LAVPDGPGGRRRNVGAHGRRAEDAITLLCFTPLNRLASPGLVPLDASAPFGNGGALLCHRDLAGHPPIQLLLETLRWRLAQKSANLPDLERL
jgi:hypothetical protein